ncbi:ROK family protein [Paenactinomyces guangxiensis]|uniref:ROK family transcriptional regulator n=1 Tax=Paenactinomyces guangxiensis TaxID=1490290 RepID=A0A7W1WQ26_9BACL|nr:ROK family transcriptional regulator [Paenactinomyces guangxiensis]MBA4493988.1 ROK family transcriptional regulator [Paenactinomyces guangxiensis]MBH8593409.1 ROK family transcriptional regulator [Paenactinomyces guangxiensis]
MRITGDQHLIKKINKSIVFETIRQKHPVSRAQISELTNLNKGTVSSLVKELIDDNLVYEIGPGQSSGGRRPVMLLFNHVAGYSIGVDLGVNYILTVLTDLEGNLVREKTTALHDLSFEAIISTLFQSIRTMISQAPDSPRGIVGIGIGVPGIVDETGTILFAPNLGWKNVNLAEMIRDEFHLPVTIHNEANAGAMGEHIFGAGKGVENLVYISVGIGIGTGIIINNALYGGTAGFSGEMGHFVIESHGKKCRCGNRGCWELYASERAFLDQAKSLSAAEAEDGDIDLFIQAANEGNGDVIRLFNQVGEYLGIGLTNIVNTFNPELIIIGNRFAKAEKWISNPIHRVIESRSLPYHRAQLRIAFSSLGTYSTALGASSFAIANFFSDMKISVE